MLNNPQVIIAFDPVLYCSSEANFIVNSLERGIIETNSLSLNSFIPGIVNKWNKDYGVCDCPSQVKEKYNYLHTSDKNYYISITPIFKKNQPETGGWRWHKWGEYIGMQKPTTEYIYDEPLIEVVYVYSIYEFNYLEKNETLKDFEIRFDGDKISFCDYEDSIVVFRDNYSVGVIENKVGLTKSYIHGFFARYPKKALLMHNTGTPTGIAMRIKELVRRWS